MLSPSRYRLKPRISLRNFLMLATCACVVLGIYSHHVHRQDAAVSLFRALGGEVAFSWDHSRDCEYHLRQEAFYTNLGLSEVWYREAVSLSIPLGELNHARDAISQLPNLQHVLVFDRDRRVPTEAYFAFKRYLSGLNPNAEVSFAFSDDEGTYHCFDEWPHP
jgi:hypothetical protein